MNETQTDRSKLGLALLVVAAATALLYIGRLDGAQWVSAVTWTVAAYMLGQVGAVVAGGWSVQAVAKAQATAKAAVQ
jgi:hypothetical protein